VITASSRRRRASIFEISSRGLAAPSLSALNRASRVAVRTCGSLVLGFLDVQDQARRQNRFLITELEYGSPLPCANLGGHRCSVMPYPQRRGVGDLIAHRPSFSASITNGGIQSGTTTAMANLAEAIRGWSITAHEQQMIATWSISFPHHRDVAPPCSSCSCANSK